MVSNAPSRSLVDCSGRLLRYCSWLTRQGAEVQTEQARVAFEEILRDIDREGQALGHDVRHVRVVLFALAVFADERVFSSEWPGRDSWLSNPLQLALFNVNSGGEDFYLRLEHLRREGGDDALLADVLECFLLCLRLGFRGRFGHGAGGERARQNLIEDLDAEIERRRNGHQALFAGHAGQQVPAGRSGLMSAWVVPSCAAAAVAVIWLVFSMLLDAEIGHFTTTVARLFP